MLVWLLSNQTIEYALLTLSVPCNSNKRGIRESYEQIAGCRIFVEKEQECRIRPPPPKKLPPLKKSPVQPRFYNWLIKTDYQSITH